MHTDALQWLMELADRGIAGDRDAAKAVVAIGQLLDAGGGAAAMCEVQGKAHDLEIEAGRGHGRAGAISALWDTVDAEGKPLIRTWAQL